MDLREALDYLSSNVLEPNQHLLGIAYDTSEGEPFNILDLSIDEDEKLENGVIYYTCSLEGGNIPSDYSGCEDAYGNDDIEEFIKLLPEFATKIKYNLYQLEEDFIGMTTEFALKIIFPELPDPDDFENDWNLTKFRQQAISLIEKVNS